MKKTIYVIVIVIIAVFLTFIGLNHTGEKVDKKSIINGTDSQEPEAVIESSDSVTLETNAKKINITVPEGFEASSTSTNEQATYFKDDDYLSILLLDDISYYTDNLDLQFTTINGIHGLYYEDEFNNIVEYGFIFADEENTYCLASNKKELIEANLESVQ